ncbi:hypothetical protein B0H10DRAFT_1949379 [Mycena sp. CBHHK59/15]|nr:hypothetical protein B0H10DRAFT_1949379 [Mycena sp. CBHHK59/15]
MRIQGVVAFGALDTGAVDVETQLVRERLNKRKDEDDEGNTTFFRIASSFSASLGGKACLSLPLASNGEKGGGPTTPISVVHDCSHRNVSITLLRVQRIDGPFGKPQGRPNSLHEATDEADDVGRSTQPSFRQGVIVWVTIASQQCAHAGGVGRKRIMGFTAVGRLRPSAVEFIITSNHCARSESKSGSCRTNAGAALELVLFVYGAVEVLVAVLLKMGKCRFARSQGGLALIWTTTPHGIGPRSKGWERQGIVQGKDKLEHRQKSIADSPKEPQSLGEARTKHQIEVSQQE